MLPLILIYGSLVRVTNDKPLQLLHSSEKLNDQSILFPPVTLRPILSFPKYVAISNLVYNIILTTLDYQFPNLNSTISIYYTQLIYFAQLNHHNNNKPV